MKHPLIACPNCLGRGQVQLSPPLVKNLQAIRKLGDPTNRQIHTLLAEDNHVTAIFRRTEKLLRLGLIKTVEQVNGAKKTERRYSIA